MRPGHPSATPRSRPGRQGLTTCARCQAVIGAAETAERTDADYCLPCAERVPEPAGEPEPETAGERCASSLPQGVTGLTPLRRQAYFARLLALRRSLEERETFEDHRDAAEIAELLGLTVEAHDHAQAWLRLRPDDVAAQSRVAKLARLGAYSGVLPDAPEPADRRARGPSEDPPFWTALGDVLTYAVRGRGVAVLTVGGVFCAAANLLATFNWFGAIVLVCLWGYVAAYQFDVIARSAAGDDSPPEFPEVLSIVDSMVVPFFAFLGCMLGAFLPCLVIVVATAAGPVPAAVGVPLAVLTFAAGFFLLPMALMLRALHQSVAPALSPRMLFGSIARILPDYLIAFCAICLIWAAHAVVSLALNLTATLAVGPPTPDAFVAADWARVGGWVGVTVIGWPVLLLALLTQCHILGRLYRQGQRRLAWFHAPLEGPQRSSPVSALLLLGAMGAAVLGTAAIAGPVMLGSDRSGSAAGASRACPLPDGSRLVYYFEDTDGPAGLVTYTFVHRADGRVEVVAETRMAGTDAADAYTETIGTFDRSSARFVSGSQSWPGEPRVSTTPDTDAPWFGPRSTSEGRTYLNDWVVRGTTGWRDCWQTWHVVDGSMDEYHYDVQSGLLVGLRRAGIGHEEVHWLVGAEGVPVLADARFPPPNRHFGD